MARVILFGPVEPVVTRAILSTDEPAFAFWTTCARGALLMDQAREVGACAVITSRDDVAELCGGLRGGGLVFGISSGSKDVLMCRGREICHVHNPTPEDLLGIIRAHFDEFA